MMDLDVMDGSRTPRSILIENVSRYLINANRDGVDFSLRASMINRSSGAEKYGRYFCTPRI
jgi:hypothetical protein